MASGREVQSVSFLGEHQLFAVLEKPINKLCCIRNKSNIRKPIKQLDVITIKSFIFTLSDFSPGVVGFDVVVGPSVVGEAVVGATVVGAAVVEAAVVGPAVLGANVVAAAVVVEGAVVTAVIISYRAQ